MAIDLVGLPEAAYRIIRRTRRVKMTNHTYIAVVTSSRTMIQSEYRFDFVT